MTDFNTRVITEFRENGGKVGPPFEGAPLVLLHSVGAKSGEQRISPLMSFPDDEGWVIVASKAGAPTNPAWYHNLIANPETTVEFGTETYEVTASVIPDEERATLWAEITANNPGFAEYEAKTERTIPLVRLTKR